MPSCYRPLGLLTLLAVAAVAAGQPKAAPQVDPRAPYPVLDTGGHNADVRGVAITPDGKTVITAGQDRTVRVRDVATGDLVRVIRLPLRQWSSSLGALALSPDGKTIATAGTVVDEGRDGSPIHLIDLETGRLVRTLNDHTALINSLAFSPNGKRLVSGSFDHTARVWDPATGKVEAVLRGHTLPVNHVAISPAGDKVLTCAADKTVRVWPAAGGKAERVLRDPEHPPHRVAWSPDGKLLASGNDDGSVTLWDATGKRLGAHLAAEKHPVRAMAFTPDSRELLCAGAPFEDPDDKQVRTARLIDVNTGAERNWVGLHSSDAVACALSADGALAVTAGGVMNEAFVWRTTDGSVVRKLQGPGAPVIAVGWSEDGRTIAWGHLRTKWDAETVYPLERTFHTGDLRPGPAPEEGAKILRAEHERKGRRLGAFNGQVKVYDGDDEVSSFNPNAGAVFGYSWLGDDLIVTATDKGLFLSTPDDGKMLRRFVGSSGRLTSVAPAADGVTFVTGGADQVVRVWRADRGRPVLSLLAAGDDWIAWTEEGVYACSPGGERLMGWQVDDGRDKLGIYMPAARFRATLYRPDVVRHLVAAGGLDAAFAAAQATKPEKLTVPDLLPPTVEITSPVGSVLREVGPVFEVTATARPTQGRPATALRLLVDGRPYQGETGVRPIAGAAEAKASWSVDLPPGLHSLTVLADSAVSRGASAPVEIRVPGKVERPALHVLAVGVNDYPDPLKLKCAAADADAIAKAFQDHGSQPYRSVDVKVLKDKDATREGIEAGLAWLKEKTTARDIAVVVFSGRVAADAKGHLALLAHAADPKEPARSGLPAARFKSLLAMVPGRVMVMLDASRPKTGRADDLVRDLLSEDCGAAVLSACQGAEKSVEEPGAKLGYFAQAVVEGLSGTADADKDGLVQWNELEAYVAARVKELSLGVMTPVTARPGGGRSFVVSKP